MMTKSARSPFLPTLSDHSYAPSFSLHSSASASCSLQALLRNSCRRLSFKLDSRTNTDSILFDDFHLRRCSFASSIERLSASRLFTLRRLAFLVHNRSEVCGRTTMAPGTDPRPCSLQSQLSIQRSIVVVLSFQMHSFVVHQTSSFDRCSAILIARYDPLSHASSMLLCTNKFSSHALNTPPFNYLCSPPISCWILRFGFFFEGIKQKCDSHELTPNEWSISE
jgi:hypothetical protein